MLDLIALGDDYADLSLPRQQVRNGTHMYRIAWIERVIGLMERLAEDELMAISRCPSQFRRRGRECQTTVAHGKPERIQFAAEVAAQGRIGFLVKKLGA